MLRSKLCRVEVVGGGRTSHLSPMDLGHEGCRFENVISECRDSAYN
jgi:hypothetical protein